jgi:type IV fimbrial biogenesis protein FimT
MNTKAAGFTLMEMLITIAIAAIVMGLAMPSYRYVTNSNRIAAELNGLLGDLQFARAEAIKEGRNVTVCVSADGVNCSANTYTWQIGWIVFPDLANPGVRNAATEPVLRMQSAFSGTDTFDASANNLAFITFNREGYAVGVPNATLITLHDSTSTTNWTRCLSINLSGLMASIKHGDTVAANGGATCN